MSNTLEKYKETVKELNKLKKKTAELAKNAFEEESKSIFANHPDLESFSWKQWEPYNDGDSTFFYVGVEEPTINGNRRYPENEIEQIRLSELQDTVAEFLTIFRKNDMLAMFGSGYMINVTRDGITKEEYYD